MVLCPCLMDAFVLMSLSEHFAAAPVDHLRLHSGWGRTPEGPGFLPDRRARVTNQKSWMIDSGSSPSSPGAARMRGHRWVISKFAASIIAYNPI